jgi:RNA polymerase sigma-70 factor (ECF subfamily)
MSVRADLDLASLVRAARAGDDRAYGEVVECCWDGLVRFARSMVGEADAEDMVQECLVRAWRELPQLRDDDRFRAWLTTAVFRRSLRWKRWSLWRRARLAEASLPDPTLGGGGGGAAAVVSAQFPDPSPQIDVPRLLSRLTRRQRAVMHLTVVDGLSDAEIAQALRMRPGTVRAHRRRARETLEAVVRSNSHDR